MAQDKKKMAKQFTKATIQAAGLGTVQQDTLKQQVKAIKRKMKKK